MTMLRVRCVSLANSSKFKEKTRGGGYPKWFFNRSLGKNTDPTDHRPKASSGLAGTLAGPPLR